VAARGLAAFGPPSIRSRLNPLPDRRYTGATPEWQGHCLESRYDPVETPISSIQYAWGDPNGHKGVITPILGGDRTIGYSHYTFSFTNSYTFDEGWLKGLGLLTNVNASYQYRSHYYPVFGPGQSPGVTPFVNLTRQLYTRPTIATVDLGLSYSRKIWGRTFSTQVNIQNAFNHYKLLFPPNPTAATAPFVTAYVRTAEPRLWVWTNSIAF
jgi:hypothetical protein